MSEYCLKKVKGGNGRVWARELSNESSNKIERMQKKKSEKKVLKQLPEWICVVKLAGTGFSVWCSKEEERERMLWESFVNILTPVSFFFCPQQFQPVPWINCSKNHIAFVHLSLPLPFFVSAYFLSNDYSSIMCVFIFFFRFFWAFSM